MWPPVYIGATNMSLETERGVGGGRRRDEGGKKWEAKRGKRMKGDSGNLDHSLTDVQRTIVIRVPFLTCHRAFITTKFWVHR